MNGVEKMRIAPDGFVGIGTSAPHPNDPYGSLLQTWSQWVNQGKRGSG